MTDVTIQQQGVKRIDIYTINGVLVYSKNCNAIIDNQKLDVSILAKGIYLLKITKEDGQTYKQKLLKK